MSSFRDRVVDTSKEVSLAVAKGLDHPIYKSVELFLKVVAIFLIALEIWALINNFSISEQMQRWSETGTFALTFAWGVLGAHFFIYRKKKIVKMKTGLAILIAIVVVMLMIGNNGILLNETYQQVILLICGGLSGYFLWPQLPLEDI